MHMDVRVRRPFQVLRECINNVKSAAKKDIQNMTDEEFKTIYGEEAVRLSDTSLEGSVGEVIEL